MRTTLAIDDEVLHAAKKRAVENGSTVSQVVNEALRRFLNQRPDPPKKPFRLPTFRGDGPDLDTLPSELDRLGDDSELVPYES